YADQFSFDGQLRLSGRLDRGVCPPDSWLKHAIPPDGERGRFGRSRTQFRSNDHVGLVRDRDHSQAIHLRRLNLFCLFGVIVKTYRLIGCVWLLAVVSGLKAQVLLSTVTPAV